MRNGGHVIAIAGLVGAAVVVGSAAAALAITVGTVVGLVGGIVVAAVAIARALGFH
jgi:hypothetical protein